MVCERGESPGDSPLCSSPRIRGKLPSLMMDSTTTRLIPARAGTMNPLKVAHVAAQAHPRSRGDHMHPPRCRTVGSGSSPHTRGPCLANLRSHCCRGLIPAHAGRPRGGARCSLLQTRLIPTHTGNTLMVTLDSASCTAHSRTRGDEQPSQVELSEQFGSSPHTRGTLTTIVKWIAWIVGPSPRIHIRGDE